MGETMEPTDDLDFYLKFAKPLILALPNAKDRILAAAWIKKLANKDSGEDTLRTQYVKLLLFMLQRRKLIGIFTDDPKTYQTLEPFPENFTIVDIAKNLLAEERRERVDRIKRKMQGDKGDQPPYSTDYSADLLEYVAAQDIPNFGVHLYYAFSKTPLPYWVNSEKGVFPKVPLAAPIATTSPSEAAELGDTCVCPTADEKPKEGEGAAAAPSGEGDVKIRDDGCRRQGAVPKKKRPRLGEEPPTQPLGVPPPAEQQDDRPPPTWGSNLLQVREPPETISQPAAFQSEVSVISEQIEDDAVSVIKEFKGEKGKKKSGLPKAKGAIPKSTPSKGAIPKKKKSPPKKKSRKKPAYQFDPAVLASMGLTEEDVAQMEFTDAELADLRAASAGVQAAAPGELDDSAEFRRQIEEMEREDAIMYREMEQRAQMLDKMLAEAEADLALDEKVIPESETVEQLQNAIGLQQQLAILADLEKELEEAKKETLPATTPKPAPCPKRPKSKTAMVDDSKIPGKKSKIPPPKAQPSKKKDKVVAKVFEEASAAASKVDFYESKSALQLALEATKAQLAELAADTGDASLYSEARALSPQRAPSPARAPTPLRPRTPPRPRPQPRQSPDAVTKAYNQMAGLYTEGLPARMPTPPHAPQPLSPETLQFQAMEMEAAAGRTPELAAALQVPTRAPTPPPPRTPPRPQPRRSPDAVTKAYNQMAGLYTEGLPARMPTPPHAPQPLSPETLQFQAMEMEAAARRTPELAAALQVPARVPTPTPTAQPAVKTPVKPQRSPDAITKAYSQMADLYPEGLPMRAPTPPRAVQPLSPEIVQSQAVEMPTITGGSPDANALARDAREFLNLPIEELFPNLQSAPQTEGADAFFFDEDMPEFEEPPLSDSMERMENIAQGSGLEAVGEDIFADYMADEDLPQLPGEEGSPVPSPPRFGTPTFLDEFGLPRVEVIEAAQRAELFKTPPRRQPAAPAAAAIVQDTRTQTVTSPPSPFIRSYTPPLQPASPPSPYIRSYTPPAPPALAGYVSPQISPVQLPQTRPIPRYSPPEDLFEHELPPEFLGSPAGSEGASSIIEDFESTICGTEIPFLDETPPMLEDEAGEVYSPHIGDILQNYEIDQDFLDPDRPEMTGHVQVGRRRVPLHREAPDPGLSPIEEDFEELMGYVSPERARVPSPVQVPAALRTPPPQRQRPPGVPGRGLLTKQEEIYLEYYAPPQERRRLRMQAEAAAQARVAGLESDFALPPISPTNMYMQFPMWYDLPPLSPSPPPPRQPTPPAPQAVAGPSGAPAGRPCQRPGPSTGAIPKKKKPFPMPRPRRPLVSKRIIPSKEPPPLPPPKGTKGKRLIGKKQPPVKRGGAKPPAKESREPTPPPPPPPPRVATPPAPATARTRTPTPPRPPSPLFAFDYAEAPDFGAQTPPADFWEMEDLTPTSPQIFDLPAVGQQIMDETPPDFFQDVSPVPSEDSSFGPIDEETGINVLRYLTERHRRAPFWPTDIRFPANVVRHTDLPAIHESGDIMSPRSAAIWADEVYQRRVARTRARNLPQPPAPPELIMVPRVSPTSSPTSSRDPGERVRPGRHRVTTTTRARRLDFAGGPQNQFLEAIAERPDYSEYLPPVSPDRQPTMFDQLMADTLSESVARPLPPPVHIPGWQTPPRYATDRSPAGAAALIPAAAAPAQIEGWRTPPQFASPTAGRPLQPQRLFGTPTTEDQYMNQLRDVNELYKIMIGPEGAPDANLFAEEAGDIFQGVSPVSPALSMGLPDFQGAEDITLLGEDEFEFPQTPGVSPAPCHVCPSPQPGPSWRRTPSPQPGPSWRRTPSPQPGPSWRRTPSPQPGPSWRRTPSPQPGPSWRRTPSPQPGPSWRRTPSPQPGPSWRRTPTPPSAPSPPTPSPQLGAGGGMFDDYVMPIDLQHKIAQQMQDLAGTPPEVRTPPPFGDILAREQISLSPTAREVLIPRTPTSPMSRPEARSEMYLGILGAKRPRVRPMHLYGYGEVPAKPLARWSYMRSRLPPIPDEGFIEEPYRGEAAPPVRPVPMRLPQYRVSDPLERYLEIGAQIGVDYTQIESEEPRVMDQAMMPAEIEAVLETGLEEEAPEWMESPPCSPCTTEDILRGYVPPPAYETPHRAAPAPAPLRPHPVFALPESPDIFARAPGGVGLTEELPIMYESPPVSPVGDLPDLPPASPYGSPVPDRMFAAAVRQHEYTEHYHDVEREGMTRRLGTARRQLADAQSPDLEAVGEISMEEYPPTPVLGELIPQELATVGPQYLPPAIAAAQRQMQALYDSPVREDPELQRLIQQYGPVPEEYIEQPHPLDVISSEAMRLPAGLLDPGIMTFSPPRAVTPQPRERTPSPPRPQIALRRDVFEEAGDIESVFDEFPPEFAPSPEAAGYGTLEEFAQIAGEADMGFFEDAQLEEYESPFASPQESAMAAAQRQLQMLYSPEARPQTPQGPCVPCEGGSPTSPGLEFDFRFQPPERLDFGPFPTSRFLSPTPPRPPSPQHTLAVPLAQSGDFLTPYQARGQSVRGSSSYARTPSAPVRSGRQGRMQSGGEMSSVRLLTKTPLSRAEERAQERAERLAKIQAARFKQPVLARFDESVAGAQGGRQPGTPLVRPGAPPPGMRLVGQRMPSGATAAARPPSGARSRPVTPAVSQARMQPQQPCAGPCTSGAGPSAATGAIRKVPSAARRAPQTPAAPPRTPRPQQPCAGPCTSQAGPSAATGAVRRRPPEPAQVQVGKVKSKIDTGLRSSGNRDNTGPPSKPSGSGSCPGARR